MLYSELEDELQVIRSVKGMKTLAEIARETLYFSAQPFVITSFIIGWPPATLRISVGKNVVVVERCRKNMPH